jgi:hypothetical protein
MTDELNIALTAYKEGNYGKCENLLQSSLRNGNRFAALMLARLYYELESPYRASVVLRRSGMEHMADLIEQFCAESQLLIVQNGKASRQTGFMLCCGIASDDNLVIMPEDKMLRKIFLEEFKGIVDGNFLKRLENM